MTKPTNCIWPYDMKQKLDSYKSIKVDKIDSERGLLGCFLAKLCKIDPDVIVGHDIFGFDISVLLHRIQVNKVPHWSRLGRVKRNIMPKLNVSFFYFFNFRVWKGAGRVVVRVLVSESESPGFESRSNHCTFMYLSALP